MHEEFDSPRWSWLDLQKYDGILLMKIRMRQSTLKTWDEMRTSFREKYPPPNCFDKLCDQAYTLV